MVRTAINLYSVRELDESTERILERVADAGYDGVQFSGGFGDATAEEVGDLLDELDLDVTAPHVGIEDLEENLEETYADYHDVLGCDGAVVPYLGEEHFESAEATDETAERLESLAGRLEERGWTLHYHNHAHEFVDLGETTAFERFIDETTIGIELDVGWAEVGGADPAELLRRLGDRAELVHMKDMDTSVERGFVEIGEGDVDMRACADAAREIGSEWLIYEHDEPENPIESIEAGAQFLNGL